MSGTHGVFQHRTGYYFTVLEEDFCELYKATGANEICRAYITSILENLTNKQYDATGCDEDIWVYMSLPEMARRMRNAYSERTIHKELQGMVRDGYLEKRRAIGKATMEYRLIVTKIRDGLASLPEKQPSKSATYHLANLQDGSCKSARLTLQNSNIDLANLQARLRTRETIDYLENTNEIPQDASALATHTPEFSSSEQESEIPDAPPRHSNRPDTDTRLSAPHGGVLDGDTQTEPAKGLTDERLDHRISDYSKPPSRHSHQATQHSDDPLGVARRIQTQHVITPVTQEIIPAPVVVESPVIPPVKATPTSLDTPKVPQAKTSRKARDATPAAAPEPKCDVQELRRRINAHRGYALEEKVEIIRENQATKSWAALHTLEEYEIVMQELTSDPYWGKPENISRVGGVTLQKETPRLLAKARIAEMRPASGSELVSHFDEKRRAAFAAEFYPSEAERRLQYAKA